MRRPRRARKTAQDGGQQRNGFVPFEGTASHASSAALTATHRHLELHHLRRRSRGGDDSAANLLTVCHDCPCRIHAGNVQLSVQPAAARRFFHPGLIAVVERVLGLSLACWAATRLGIRLRRNRASGEIRKSSVFSLDFPASCGRILI